MLDRLLRSQAFALKGWTLNQLERLQRTGGGKPSEHIGFNLTMIGCDTTKEPITFSEMRIGRDSDVTDEQRNEWNYLNEIVEESTAGM